MRRFASVVFLGILASCTDTESEHQITGSGDAVALVQIEAPDGALANALWQRPSLTALRWEYQSALANFAATKAATGWQSGGAITAGGYAAGGSAQAAGTATLNAERVMADGGRNAAAQAEALLTANLTRNNYALAVDDILFQFAVAILQHQQATHTVQIVGQQLSEYRAREAQISQAAAIGVLTNSDLLTIQSGLTEIETVRASAQTQLRLAELQLSQLLPDPRGRADAIARFERWSGQVPARLPNWRLAAADASVSLAEARLQSAKVANAPTLSASGRLESPLGDPAATLFAGVRYQFTLSDGGLSQSNTAAAQAGWEAQRANRESLALELTTARRTLDVQLSGRAAQEALLQERLAQSAERVDGLEKLMIAGRSDVAALSREILAQAQTRIALVNLQAQSQQDVLSFVRLHGATCALFSVCDQIELPQVSAP